MVISLSLARAVGLTLVLVSFSHIDAFSASCKPFAVTRSSINPISYRPLRMADTDEKTEAPRKQLVFDEESGKLFETGFDEGEGDCLPEEEFCKTDKATGKAIRLTVEEKERIFLDALQSYYTTGRQMLDDDEFDLLKEDLQWSGSEVAALNRKEATYLNAMQNYLKGTPSMSDTEFDQLKKELMEEGSKFAVSTEPKCYIDTGICKVTLQEDKFRSNLLYLPAAALLSTLWLGLGYELVALVVRINPLLFLLLGTPLFYKGSVFITEELLFQNKLIAYGPCPNCGFENRVYFGDILGVEGFGDVAAVKCPNCKDQFNVQRDTLRASTLPKV